MTIIPTLQFFGSSDLFSALGIDIRLLIIQAASFLVLVFILAKFAYPTILKSIEDYRHKIEQSLLNAKKIEADLKDTEKKSAEIVRRAQKEADEIIGRSKREASGLIDAAELRALKRTKEMIDEANAQIESDRTNLRRSLRQETAELVAKATAQLLKEKINVQSDAKVIASSIEEAQ